MTSQYLVQSIGWTLIHSLWQALLVYLLVRIVLRLTNRSDFRYGVGVVAMALTVVCSGITFMILNEHATAGGFNVLLNATLLDSANSVTPVQTVLEFINQNIIWFIRFWTLGFVVGLLRIAAGLWYINRLRSHANPVQEEWTALVKDLSGSLNITRVVTMAEAGISSPMVVGFMKPMILFPVGLLAGLTVDQVETILVHELAHIRRQDYIINLLQSVIETIFFFNPFVLLISSLIREERENCCDDIVIAKGISPISYVRTLAQLEASCLPARSSSSLALGIAGSQNQLLNRIKRIMEKSAKNEWGKGRLVPVALLFLGFICASWLSIGTEPEANTKAIIAHNVVASDTSKEDGLKVIKRGRSHRSWNTTEPVEPIEPVPSIEFVPDDMDFQMSFQMGPLPEFPIEAMDFDAPDMIIEIPEFPMTPMEPFEFGFDHFFDSIPGYTYSFRVRDPEGKADFEKEFTMKFKENFKEFYEKNQEKFDKMMEDVWYSEKVQKVTKEGWKTGAADVVDLTDMARQAGRESYLLRKMSDDALLSQQESAVEQARAMEEMNTAQMAMKIGQEQMGIALDQLRASEEIAAEMERRTGNFKKELMELLRDDGYIKKDEKFESFNLSDDNGKMTINGHVIKEKDQVKYRALHDKYFKTRLRDNGYRRSE